MSDSKYVQDTRNCNLKLDTITSDELEKVCANINIPVQVVKRGDGMHSRKECIYKIGNFVDTEDCDNVSVEKLLSSEFQQFLLQQHIKNHNISNSSYVNEPYIPTNECLGMIDMHEKMCQSGDSHELNSADIILICGLLSIMTIGIVQAVKGYCSYYSPYLPGEAL